jgi:hypothetical protein
MGIPETRSRTKGLQTLCYPSGETGPRSLHAASVAARGRLKKWKHGPEGTVVKARAHSNQLKARRGPVASPAGKSGERRQTAAAPL